MTKPTTQGRRGGIQNKPFEGLDSGNNTSSHATLTLSCEFCHNEERTQIKFFHLSQDILLK